jgi:hypothetical protein
MHLKSTVAVLAVAGLSLAGCHSSTPTSSSGPTIIITGSVINSALQPTLLEAQLLFDGTEVMDGTLPAPGPSINLSAEGPTTSGAHVVTFLIANQTSSPNKYTVTGATVEELDANGNVTLNIPLPTMTATLATGQVIQYNVTL